MSGLRRPIRRYSLARIRQYVREAFDSGELNRKLVTLEENIDQALQSVQADRDTPRPANIVRGVMFDADSTAMTSTSEVSLTSPELIDGNGMVLSGSRLVNASARTIRARVYLAFSSTGGAGAWQWKVTKNGDPITGAEVALTAAERPHLEVPGLVTLEHGDYLAFNCSVAGSGPTLSQVKLSAMEVGN